MNADKKNKDIIYKDEASMIQVGLIRDFAATPVDGVLPTYAQVLEHVQGVAVLDQYGYAIDPEARTLTSGRTGETAPFSSFPKYLQNSLQKIIDGSSAEGDWVYYIWAGTPLFKDYLKKAFVQSIFVEGREMIIGSGYPLEYIRPKCECECECEQRRRRCRC